MVEETSVRTITVSIPFTSAETASLVQEVLNVDRELKASEVQREIVTSEENVIINFRGGDLKKLRVGVNSILKNILLIVKTIDQFQN